MTTRTVLIVDDDRDMCDAVADGLRDRGWVATTCNSGSDALAKLGETFDALVTDLRMPGKSGLDILDDIKRLRPRIPVLLLTMHPEEQYARRALKAGAAGYLTKDSVPDELTTAIKKIAAGGRYISATLAEKLAVDLRRGADVPLHELLSDREFQVLRMLASGKTIKEMAEELSLSVKTVSTYRGRILEKTGMKTNAELIRYALESQLVD